MLALYSKPEPRHRDSDPAGPTSPVSNRRGDRRQHLLSWRKRLPVPPSALTGSASALTVSVINGFVARVSAYARAKQEHNATLRARNMSVLLATLARFETWRVLGGR
jgi:hypothetical protein